MRAEKEISEFEDFYNKELIPIYKSKGIVLKKIPSNKDSKSGENMRTLQKYLEDCEKENIIDFSFRAEKKDDGYQITIHPDNQSGETVDYIVKENNLKSICDTKPS
jgi:hypothetical protein